MRGRLAAAKPSRAADRADELNPRRLTEFLNPRGHRGDRYRVAAADQPAQARWVDTSATLDIFANGPPRPPRRGEEQA